MNIWLSVVILALIQGLTEFLPVSSSGHLAVLSQIFGLHTDEGLAFGIVLHAGSLLAIAVYYFKTLLGFFKKEQFHLLLMVILGSIPAGIFGIILKKSGFMELLFSDMLSIGMAFLITGSLLRLTGKKQLTPQSVTDLKDITVKQALVVGFTQMIAITPGISRSGSTIAAGILSGIKFEAAAAFSFLLALPAVGGATLLELIDLYKRKFALDNFTVLQLTGGFLISAVTSMGALILLANLVQKGKLSIFSWYLYAIGMAVIIWQIIQMNG